MRSVVSARPALALAALAAALVALVASASAASAHTQLVGVDPGEGSTVEAGQTVTLTFSEDLLELGAEATVTGPSGEPTPAEIVPSGADAVITLPALEGGDVTLAWRIVANDGHPIDGTLAFVADAPAAVPSESPSPSASASASATPSEMPSAEPSEPATDDEGDGSNSGTNVAVWIAIGAALFAALGGGTAAASSKKKQGK